MHVILWETRRRVNDDEKRGVKLWSRRSLHPLIELTLRLMVYWYCWGSWGDRRKHTLLQTWATLKYSVVVWVYQDEESQITDTNERCINECCINECCIIFLRLPNIYSVRSIKHFFSSHLIGSIMKFKFVWLRRV